MPILTEGDLAWMGSEEGTTLPDLCNISRPSNTQDDYGGTTLQFSTVATNVTCDWEVTSDVAGMERLVASRVDAVAPYKIRVPELTDVLAKDRVIILARGNEPERTYEVRVVLHAVDTMKRLIATLEG